MKRLVSVGREVIVVERNLLLWDHRHPCEVGFLLKDVAHDGSSAVLRDERVFVAALGDEGNHGLAHGARDAGDLGHGVATAEPKDDHQRRHEGDHPPTGGILRQGEEHHQQLSALQLHYIIYLKMLDSSYV